MNAKSDRRNAPETRAKISAAIRARHQADPDYRARTQVGLDKGREIVKRNRANLVEEHARLRAELDDLRERVK